MRQTAGEPILRRAHRVRPKRGKSDALSEKSPPDESSGGFLFDHGIGGQVPVDDMDTEKRFLLCTDQRNT